MTHTMTPLLGHTVGIRRVIDETDDAKSIVFDIPPELRDAFAYRPGQFLTLRIPSDTTGFVARCYSLASSPHADDELKVTVKRTAGGYGSNWLCDNAVTGAELRVLPPAGTFTPDDLGGDLLLFAAGSGITPAMSILKSVLAQSDAQVTLFYANRDEASIIFGAELRELAAAHAGRLVVTHWLETERGLPTVAGLSEFAERFPDRPAYLCGPAPFMDAVRHCLITLGVDRKRIHAEEFLSLHGDPFAPAPPIPADGDRSTVVVHLDGATHTLSWPAAASLVDVLLEAGIDAPFSCRSGECGSCTATLTTGTVEMACADALDPDDVADGYILACQAHPTSPYLEVEF
ncbi:3-ketosteroid 9alpha-monooxygenase subunit B [Nocardia sp. GAS34]|uniref:2Fe-2S iron-sulfur cluster-binding protein n=1 Tax=unclassified Nocardia TaxID=2637762 RepID=UPI003D1A006D